MYIASGLDVEVELPDRASSLCRICLGFYLWAARLRKERQRRGHGAAHRKHCKEGPFCPPMNTRTTRGMTGGMKIEAKKLEVVDSLNRPEDNALVANLDFLLEFCVRVCEHKQVSLTCAP